jgi:hypothetical protein
MGTGAGAGSGAGAAGVVEGGFNVDFEGDFRALPQKADPVPQ